MSIEIQEYIPKENLEKFKDLIMSLTELESKRSEEVAKGCRQLYKTLMFFGAFFHDEKNIDDEAREVVSRTLSAVYYLFCRTFSQGDRDYFENHIKEAPLSLKILKGLMEAMIEYHKEISEKVAYEDVKDTMGERIYEILERFKGEFKETYEINRAKFNDESRDNNATA